MSLSVGEKLGPYEIFAPLAAGGMGEVWKARDTRLNRVVAIKRLKGQHTGRLEQEARAIAALNHPNICVLYDIGPDYLVIDYEPGFSTKRLLVRTPRGLPMEYENAQKRILDVLGQWKARALLTARLAGMPLAPSM